jgi:hypothetical protein
LNLFVGVWLDGSSCDYPEEKKSMLGTYVVSTKLNFPPCDAPNVVEKWHRSLRRVTAAGRSIRRVGGGLLLADTPQHPSCDPLELYRVRGVLWVHGRPTRVTLEFSTWSADACQAALRPARLSWPVQTEHYERRAMGVLEDVVGSVISHHVPVGTRSVVAMPRPAWLPPLVGMLLR